MFLNPSLMHCEWYIIVWLCGELQYTWLPLFNITHMKGFCCFPRCCTLGCTLFYYSCCLILWKCSRWPVETCADNSRGSEVLVLGTNTSSLQSCWRKYTLLFLTQQCSDLLEIYRQYMFISHMEGFILKVHTRRFPSLSVDLVFPVTFLEAVWSYRWRETLRSAQMKIDGSNVQRQHMRLIIFN